MVEEVLFTCVQRTPMPSINEIYCRPPYSRTNKHDAYDRERLGYARIIIWAHMGETLLLLMLLSLGGLLAVKQTVRLYGNSLRSLKLNVSLQKCKCPPDLRTRCRDVEREKNEAYVNRFQT